MTNSTDLLILKKGGIGIIPTDTIYGIVGSALKAKTVERLYTLKKRDRFKPFIVLISSFADLKKFDISPNTEIRKKLSKLWPGKVSVLLPCESNKFKYLHRGKKAIAFRLPKDHKLRKILKIAGPLAAPSANLQGRKPASNITAARRLFGNRVDFYNDGGRISSRPSTLIALNDNRIQVLRSGAVKINKSTLD